MLTKLPSFNDPTLYVFLWNGEFCGEGHYFYDGEQIVIPWEECRRISISSLILISKSGRTLLNEIDYVRYIIINVPSITKYIPIGCVITSYRFPHNKGEIIYIDTTNKMRAKMILRKNKSGKYLMRIL